MGGHYKKNFNLHIVFEIFAWNTNTYQSIIHPLLSLKSSCCGKVENKLGDVTRQEGIRDLGILNRLVIFLYPLMTESKVCSCACGWLNLQNNSVAILNSYVVSIFALLREKTRLVGLLNPEAACNYCVHALFRMDCELGTSVIKEDSEIGKPLEQSPNNVGHC